MPRTPFSTFKPRYILLCTIFLFFLKYGQQNYRSLHDYWNCLFFTWICPFFCGTRVNLNTITTNILANFEYFMSYDHFSNFTNFTVLNYKKKTHLREGNYQSRRMINPYAVLLVLPLFCQIRSVFR